MSGRDAAPGPGTIRSWMGLFARRWRAGVVSALVIAAAVAAVLLLSRPVYRADARLRLGEPPPSGGVAPTTGLISLLRPGGDPFANDLELLGSRTVAEEVVEEIALNVRLVAPRGWYRDSLLTSLEADRTTTKASYRAEWGDDGVVRVRMESPRDSSVARAKPGEQVYFGGLSTAFRPAREGMPTSVRFVTQPFDEVARRQVKRLQVERTRREANVLSVTFEHNDPVVARQAVDATVRRFMALRALIEARESDETVDSLRTVAKTTRHELERAEGALEEWQRESMLVAPDAQSEAFLEQYTVAVGALEAARIEFAGIDSVVRRLAVETEPTRTWATLMSHPSFLANEPLAAMLSRVSALEEQRLELITRRAQTSREFSVVEEQIASLDGSLRTLASGYRAAVGTQVRDLEAQVARMDADLARLPGNAVELERRLRAVRLLSELVALTEQRLRQEELRQALMFSNVQVIDPPKLRERPVWPRPKLGAAIGLVLAGMFGMLAMVVTEAADPTLRAAARIRTVIDAPVVATALRGKRGARMSERDVRAVSAAATRAGATTLTLAPVTTESAAAVADALRAAGASAGVPLPTIRVASAATQYGGAAEAATTPVLLVIEQGRTHALDATRAAGFVREADGALLGAVLLCRDERAARNAWG